tara:strand:+ start:195 stop:1079 length:885 start_codon:yes stop_codon:yes gene_type:complete
MIRREEKEIFGTSFLDVISCALGAVILMMLLAKNGDTRDVTPDDLSQPIGPVPIDLALQKEVRSLEASVSKLASRASVLQERLKDSLIKNDRLERSIQTNSAAKGKASDNGSIDSVYTGGIPVGREYVIFIVDTSGSMKQNWAVVTSTIRGLMAAHPRVKGLQIMNDNGNYLIKGYAGKWIPDTDSARKRAMEKFALWQSFSNSSPAEGLEKALKIYAQRQDKVSIYVLGDDFSGESYELVTTVIQRWNVNRSSGERRAIIHGIGFPWGLEDRFSTLMREVSYQNGGVFVALPK